MKEVPVSDHGTYGQAGGSNQNWRKAAGRPLPGRRQQQPDQQMDDYVDETTAGDGGMGGSPSKRGREA